MGNPIFVVKNYKPMLGPFTDTWDDLVNDNGDRLHFGVLHYNNTTTSTFRERVKPRDVKAALVLLTYFFLEHHTVKDSLLFDSSMLLIKASSEGAGVHSNSIGKPNRMFAWFVIDFLAMSILFYSFIDHRLLVAPMPFKKIPLSEAHVTMLVHNKEILIKFCLGQGLPRVDKYFVNEMTGDVGRGCLDLDKLWSTSTKFYRQLKSGIVSSFDSYKDSYTGDKKEQKLWIHHFVILQLFHPLFRFYPGDDSDLQFQDDNHNLFVEKITDSHIKYYVKMYGDTPNYSWLWLGDGCKI
jgi:hypothetical protein